tara:strand:- start:9997 stop:11322 length:1326 start_codon:yes stop_codon:yes gene_type:complete
MNPKQCWRAALGELEMQMTSASFSTWLKDASFLDCDDNVYIVGVKSGFVKDWLNARMKTTIERTLSGIARQKTAVSFVVWPDTDNLPEPVFSDDLIHKDKVASKANPSHTTQTLKAFVTGPENQLALAAATTLAEVRSDNLNPLFLYGGTGVGKTHLLSGVAHRCKKQGLSTEFITSEMFTNKMVSSIKNGSAEMFREKYRTCDVLLVDDIQFFVGKKSSSEELLHTIDHLLSINSSVVLSSNVSLSSLSALGKRLSSRISSGLVLEVSKPSLETRVQITKNALLNHSIQLAERHVLYLAKHLAEARQLEGAIKFIFAHSSLLKASPSFSLVQLAVQKAVVSSSGDRSSEKILQTVANKFNVTISDLCSKNRARRFSVPRQLAVLLLKDVAGCSLSEIGSLMGGRDHTTAKYGYQKAHQLLTDSEELRESLEEIRKTIFSQ